MKIKEIYEKLPREEEVVFQVKTKKVFIKIINEMKEIFDKWDFMFIEEDLDYKDTYFILGAWRDGMFELRNGKKWNCEKNAIHILADYKELPIEEIKHLKQIDNLIEIMDKYRNNFTKKELKLNKDFDLVKKRIEEE